jgi:iron-only hydrogenase group A
MSTVTGEKVKATINGIPVEVAKGTFILDAAQQVQIKIPVLCKHPDLPPEASCGICVVKIKGTNKMVRSCCTPIEQGMEITTHDPEIVDVRRTLLQLILSNHPNDCLKCARNYECELQRLTAEFGIKDAPFPRFLRDLKFDHSTRAVDMDKQKCILCGRCVYVCQMNQNVWALSFLERSINTRIAPAGDIELADGPCIRCGQCSAHCPTGALVEQDHTARVWQALQDPDKYCVAQIAPAVRASIGEAFGLMGVNTIKKMYSLLRRMGFKAVFDTSFGADVTIMEEATELKERLLHNTGPLPMITTCCPAWVDFMEKFHRDFIDHFTSCKSPHEIIGVLAKTYYAEKAHVDPSKIVMVSIMPCTAKKYEVYRSGEMFASGFQDIDVVLCTREMARMIKQAGVDFNHIPDEGADSILGEYAGAGVIFGATGGVAEAALRTAHYFITGEELKKVEFNQIRGLQSVKEARVKIGELEIGVAVAHGLNHVEYILNKVRDAKKNNQPIPYQIMEVMACPGGCVGGGGQPYMVTDTVRAARINALYQDDSAREIRCSHQNPYVRKLYEEFLGQPHGEKAMKLLHTSYEIRPTYTK